MLKRLMLEEVENPNFRMCAPVEFHCATVQIGFDMHFQNYQKHY